MVRGRRRKTVSESEDWEERERVEDRRKRNRAAAERHRNRKRLEIEEGKEYKEKFEQLLAHSKRTERRLAKVEKEKRKLLSYVLTHNCVSPRQHREHFISMWSGDSASANHESALNNYPPLSIGPASTSSSESFEQPSPYSTYNHSNYPPMDPQINCGLDNTPAPSSNYSNQSVYHYDQSFDAYFPAQSEYATSEEQYVPNGHRV